MTSLRIGSGAGYAGDRIEPAVELAEHGALDYLGFECLAERTIALAQQARLADPEAGYDRLLEQRFRAVLPACHANQVTVITNMGAANPAAAARRTREIAAELGLHGLRIAYVTGDDVLNGVLASRPALFETRRTLDEIAPHMLSANAYLGATPIVAALERGADIVITGRVADPALFAAPLIHEFGWAMDDWSRLGQATVIGHLLECAGQITGGYFADPPYKTVSSLARLGFPIAEVEADGSAVITKVAGSGGRITAATCTEQLLYEIHDPARYITPDVVADFSNVRFTEQAPDRIHVSGATGQPAPETAKVSVGYHDGFIGEGQISYGGPGAIERGRLALDIVKERLELTGAVYEELRAELIGIDSLFGNAPEPTTTGTPVEVRARVAARTQTRAQAERIGEEVETLYTNGPAAGGGATKQVREVIAVASARLPWDAIQPKTHLMEPV